MPRKINPWAGKQSSGGAGGKKSGERTEDVSALSPSPPPPGAPREPFSLPQSLPGPREDLSSDKLLATVPRAKGGDRSVPVLGGVALLSQLGHGGMGAVYLGFHLRLHRLVAVKVLPLPFAAERPQRVERFLREARLAAQINSPRVVGVFDVNEEGGLFYLVMELIKGKSAQDCLRETKDTAQCGLAEKDALTICRAATEGLAAAHARDVIHRDIKPANILIPASGDGKSLLLAEAKLADMGLARGGDEPSLTGSLDTLGSPGFMAPEQAFEPRSVGKPADVFGMGATLYALLAGAPPFTGESAPQVILATLNKPLPPVQSQRADVSERTRRLLEKCLEKKPEDRFADAHALLKAMQSAEACD